MRRRILAPAVALALVLSGALALSTRDGTAIARTGGAPAPAALIGHRAFRRGPGHHRG